MSVRKYEAQRFGSPCENVYNTDCTNKPVNIITNIVYNHCSDLRRDSDVYQSPFLNPNIYC